MEKDCERDFTEAKKKKKEQKKKKKNTRLQCLQGDRGSK